MSYSQLKSFRPCSPSISDHESIILPNKATSPNNTKDSKSPGHTTKDPFFRTKSDGSDASSYAGGRLTEAPGRLTPTCPGRMKAPPICRDKSLKRVASTIQDIECFSPEEAESCAEKCLIMTGENKEENVEDAPFNVGGGECYQLVDPTRDVKPKGKPSMSSSSTVVTNTSASIGAIGVQPLVVRPTKKDPPLKVVRTDDCLLNSEDETGGFLAENKAVPSPPPSPKHLSSSFTDKLIKDAQSRQGRSLQRWLLHSQTDSLVREVAGCIPITRDGRIVLVSASRKNEWILPKGGWDSDETKEECAVRETYEEAGLLGKLGSCLTPIDYESGKSKKRRLEASIKPGSEGLPPVAKKAKSELKESETTQYHSPSNNGSESPKLFFIRLLLFPLYITEVKSDWPEKGRLRTLVNIDEAIKIMEQEKRFYFKRGLEMVREMGLHLVHKQNDGFKST